MPMIDRPSPAKNGKTDLTKEVRARDGNRYRAPVESYLGTRKGCDKLNAALLTLDRYRNDYLVDLKADPEDFYAYG